MKNFEYIKFFLKSWIPKKEIEFLKNLINLVKFRKFRVLTLEQTFDEIYIKKIWTPKNSEMLSGPGSYGKVASEYVFFLEKFIKENNIKTITDIGCGDFNIGSQVCGLVENYNALDVSNEIIKRNKKAFSSLKNVFFTNCNACSSPIPQADLVTIREVFQHLGNAQIEAVLNNVQASHSKYALISEMSHSLERIASPNLDIRIQGPITRSYDRSAVVISDPPFSRNAKIVATLNSDSQKECRLYIYLWDLA